MITKDIFHSFLKCETKAYLKYSGTVDTQSKITEMQREIADKYKQKCAKHLISKCQDSEYKIGMPFPQNFDDKNTRFFIDFEAHAEDIKSSVHAVERLFTKVKKHESPFIPYAFVPYEKITRHHKLILSFDALLIQSITGKLPLFGKIIYGNKRRIIKVKLETFIENSRNIIHNITSFLKIKKLPALILNKHCSECNFRSYCHKKAIEKDELSLLARMSPKERRKYNTQGIFTITQLSHTFRPRKQSKLAKSPKIRYYHPLKALAIREQKIYIVGKPELKIIGTPIYLDVEGIPDQDFYYLIGLRVRHNNSFLQHSFWADEISDEKEIWQECLQVLSSLGRPQIMHYGSYETKFLKRMKQRHRMSLKEINMVDQLIESAQNVLNAIYGQIYFPTYSNSLKEIARFLGFRWTEKKASGQRSVLWRYKWDITHETTFKEKLVVYNTEDCEALEWVTNAVMRLIPGDKLAKAVNNEEVVHTDNMKREYPYQWGNTQFLLPELQYINKCAYWDYQRDKIYIKSNPVLKRIAKKKSKKSNTRLKINKIIQPSSPVQCSLCGATKIRDNGRHRRLLYDLKFSQSGVKRWIVKYLIKHYKCQHCGNTFASDRPAETRHRYGLQLLAYVIYLNIELSIPQLIISRNVNSLFGYNMSPGVISRLKKRASKLYSETYEIIKKKLVQGKLIHADETQISIKGQTAYVWVFTSLEEVIYVFSETREGMTLKNILSGFKGVLVSDFYTAYDAIDCPQQKCLIHLIRDLNNDLHKEPFNEEIKLITKEFAALLQPIIETIHRFGLKRYFLNKHKSDLQRFYKNLQEYDYKTEVALRYKKRLEKYQNKLFKFLDYDGIPWNNNNAEHAIRAFAQLRKVIKGITNERGIRQYLILLSVSETCKCKGISFLDFLLSGKRDIYEYIKSNK